MAQFALEANGYADHAAWLYDWRQTRSAQVFVLGSKDETAGCPGCVLRPLGEDRFALRLRLPNAAATKYLTCEVHFAYGAEHLQWALDAGQALSYRFVRDAKGWRVFASTQAKPVARSSDPGRGALGVDLNADHVALSQTNGRGNLVAFERVDLVTYGKSADQTKALLGDAVKAIVARAVEQRVPIVLSGWTLRARKRGCASMDGAMRACSPRSPIDVSCN